MIQSSPVRAFSVLIAIAFAFSCEFSNGCAAADPRPQVSDLMDLLAFDGTLKFRLNDGSTVLVDYEIGKVSIELGSNGPIMRESYTEDDFGGVYWDWGQVVPQADGTWLYEDWLNDGFKSEAVPVESVEPR